MAVTSAEIALRLERLEQQQAELPSLYVRKDIAALERQADGFQVLGLETELHTSSKQIASDVTELRLRMDRQEKVAREARQFRWSVLATAVCSPIVTYILLHLASH